MPNSHDDHLEPQRIRDAALELLRHIVDTIVSQIPADYLAIYALNRDLTHLESIAVRAINTNFRVSVSKTLNAYIQELSVESGSRILGPDELAKSGLCSALLVPMALRNQLIGAVVLLTVQQYIYTENVLAQLGEPLNLIRMALENIHLTEQLMAARSIVSTARAIAKNSSPQELVNILHDQLLDDTVSSCAMLLFGPLREDRPNGPFEYLEIQGIWSRRYGSGLGIGVQFPMPDSRELVRRLSEEKYLLYTDSELDMVAEILPAHGKTMLQIEDVHSLAVVPLFANDYPIGLIAITSAAPHVFTARQLRTYQTVGEFLAVSAIADVLRQHHNFVQQGRAALLDAVTDGVMMVLPDADESRVLTVNQQFTDLFGLAERDAQGLLLPDLIEKMLLPGSVRQTLHKLWGSIPIRERSAQNGEFVMSSAKDPRTSIQWYSAPVYRGSEVLGRIYTFHDVTAERTADRLRYGLLSRISHELRTPLTSISGFASLILEGGDTLPDQARQYVETIHKSAKHLNRLFTDMIEIARANAGEVPLNLADQHLPDLVIDVVARLEPQRQHRNQKLIMELDDDLPPVIIDGDRIAQVLINLLDNAMKYSPDGSTIRVSTRLIPTSEQLPTNAPPDVVTPCVLVMVVDQGKGLPRDEVEKVFLPFYRTDSAKQSRAEGSGLGLAFSRSLIELHHGSIWAEANQRGRRGGRFLFTIPLVK